MKFETRKLILLPIIYEIYIRLFSLIAKVLTDYILCKIIVNINNNSTT